MIFLSQVVSSIPFVTVADIAQYLALQVGGASLESGAGKYLTDDIIKSLESIAVRISWLDVITAPLLAIRKNPVPVFLTYND